MGLCWVCVFLYRVKVFSVEFGYSPVTVLYSYITVDLNADITGRSPLECQFFCNWQFLDSANMAKHV